MRETSTAPLIGWSRAFPATPAQVREARQFLAGILDGHPATDDAILCLSELATNATIHSRSREPGGHFRVRAESARQPRPGGSLRPGRPLGAIAHEDEQNGRGLLVVAQLARNFGRTGDDQAGWTVWFECG